jgi:2-polyprenyl-3-methyl-5-hydroxy-6-metoxy-1,4-benzoquinol methylase
MPLIRNFSDDNGIHIFDSQLDPNYSVYDERLILDQEKVESSHFWFIKRREKISNFFVKYIDKKSKVLEIGGGTGYIAKHLINAGFKVDLSDIHINGLKFAHSKGVPNIYQFDLYAPPFKDEYNIICLFDVLEHQKDDKLAIECLKYMLAPKGKILITVPAHMWLWNRDDKINGHYKRYTKKSLQTLCQQLGLNIIHVEYFFTFLTPFLLARSFLKPDHNGYVDSEETLGFKMSNFMNIFLSNLVKFEFFLSKWISYKFGGSILLYAEKI